MSGLVPCLALVLGVASAQQHVDPAWFRQTLRRETALRRDASSAPNGFFRPSLDRQWRPLPKQTGTLVSQCRLIFVMAAGYDETRDPAFRDALTRAADFLLKYFRDAENGGYFYSVSPEGAVLDENKDAYGHAFVIFGLSHAARVTGDRRYREAAFQAWRDMKSGLRYDSGFVKPRTTRDFKTVRGTNSQNPMMHLFEALLALYDAAGDRAILAEAGTLADAIYGRLFRDREGYLPELYDPEWNPLPPDQKGYIEMGHQFEWAFLLSEAVDRGLPSRYLATARRLLDYGMRAYDPEAGGIYSRGDYPGTVRREPKGWWEQCEHLRALLHWAARRDRPDLWPTFDRSLAFVKANFIDPEYGGWYASFDPAVPPDKRNTAKGTVWMTGYHAVGFYREALKRASAR